MLKLEIKIKQFYHRNRNVKCFLTLLLQIKLNFPYKFYADKFDSLLNNDHKYSTIIAV